MTGVEIAYLVVALAGTATGIYASNQAAKTQDKVVAYNSKLADQQAKREILSAQIAAQNEKRDADTQAMWATYQAQVANGNARLLESQAAVVDRNAREDIRRKRADNESVLGDMRARVAKSGTLIEGAPSLALVESAGILELDALNIGYEAELTMRSLYSDASAARAEAASATGTASFAGAAARDSVYTAYAGRFTADRTRQSAEFDRWYAGANKEATKLNNYATALYGAGQMASTYSNRKAA